MGLVVIETKNVRCWRGWLERLPVEYQDIHWSHELYAAYEIIYGWKAHLIASVEGGQSSIYPTLRDGDRLNHAYNFGGPLGSDAVGIGYDLVDYKRREGIKHERCTLHPLFQERQRAILEKSPYHITFDKDAVYIDLTQPLELRTTHRQMCGYARDRGVTVVQVALDTCNLSQFNMMYQDSMQRKNAAQHWRFPRSFFPTMAECLEERMTMFFTYVGGELEAGCVVIHDYATAYYHYSASIGKHDRIGVNHAMVVAVSEWAREEGYKKLFLGGGVKENDGLFFFKSGFSKERVPVYRYEIQT